MKARDRVSGAVTNSFLVDNREKIESESAWLAISESNIFSEKYNEYSPKDQLTIDGRGVFLKCGPSSYNYSCKWESINMSIDCVLIQE